LELLNRRLRFSIKEFKLTSIQSYLRVIRRLILIYTLEPAGSHGVWGLDDHFFLPYIFGSAQYCPAIRDGDSMPIEGSLVDSPDPANVAKHTYVDHERKNNMYFAAVGFINDVKTGPFWEHSPILFDISGVRSGWGKINKVNDSILGPKFWGGVTNISLGNDQDVQCRSAIQVSSRPALLFWIFIQLGRRS